MSASRVRHRACLLVFSLSFLQCRVIANCYWPNGTDRNSAPLPADLYSACHPNAAASMCCALDASSPYLNDNSGSICRSDGLCINGNGKYISRTACTDQSWRSPECIKLCVNDIAQAGNDYFITTCADGSYCCGNDAVATNCCQSGLGYFVVNGETTRANPSGTSSSIPIRSPTSSSTPDPQTVTQVMTSAPLATSASPMPLSERRRNSGVIAGAVVGGVLGLAIIVGACWVLIHRRPKSPLPSSKLDPRFPSKLGSEDLSEAPTYSGNINSNELPGPDISRPELSGLDRPRPELVA